MNKGKLQCSLALIASLMMAENSQAAQKPEIENNSQNLIPNNLFASRCPERMTTRSGGTIFTSHDFPQRYYRVTTSGGELRLRGTPGGNIVGGIPNGWEVYVARFDSTRRWAYVRHVSSPYYYGFYSAPNFNSDGWVSVDFLRYMGQFCDKPLMFSLTPETNLLGMADNSFPSNIALNLETEILDKLNQK